MSYRPRESIVVRGSQGSRGQGGSGLASSQTVGGTGNRKPKQEPEDNEDILLRDDEIVQCLNSIGLNFTLSDLQKPTPPQVQSVYEHLVDELMGIRRETVEPMLAVALEEIEYPETHRDSMSLMAFYRSLARLMAVCSIADFSFSDLTRPEYKRLKYNLSHIINFTRFRQDAERGDLIAKQQQRPETARERLHDLIDENTRMIDRIAELEEQQKRDGPAIKIAEEVNEAITQDLREMKKEQTIKIDEYEKEKSERKSLQTAIKDRNYMVVKAKVDCETCRRYIMDSPEQFQRAISDMSNSLIAEKSSFDQMERKTRALQTSAESFTLIEADINACIKVMEDCETEAIKLEEITRKVLRQEEVLKSRENEKKDLERGDTLLQRQLEHLKERIERSRVQAEQKRESAHRKMAELKNVYDDLSRERFDKNREMEKKKMRIEQIEKKMADLRELIEIEVHRAHEEMAKMKAHIEGYIREMEQRIHITG